MKRSYASRSAISTTRRTSFVAASVISFITATLLSSAVFAGEVEQRSLSAQPLLEKFERGHINWEKGEYIANVSVPTPVEYRGRPVNQAMAKELALRTSRALADSVFLQIVADTRVNAEHRLSEMVKTDTEIKLTGNIRGKVLIKQDWVTKQSSLWLQASYRIDMRGVDGVISNIYDQAIETRPAITEPAASQTATSNSEGSTDTADTVVIDARGTGLQPALFPCIMDLSHARLMDTAKAGKAYVAENGTVEYVVAETGQRLSALADMENAIFVQATPDTGRTLQWFINDSLAEQPAVRKRKKRTAMKATEAEGLLKSNIIVGTEDANRLRSAQSTGKLAEYPRIIVITDGTVGGTEGRLTGEDILWAVNLPWFSQQTR